MSAVLSQRGLHSQEEISPDQQQLCFPREEASSFPTGPPSEALWTGLCRNVFLGLPHFPDLCTRALGEGGGGSSVQVRISARLLRDPAHGRGTGRACDATIRSLPDPIYTNWGVSPGGQEWDWPQVALGPGRRSRPVPPAPPRPRAKRCPTLA